MPIEPNTGEWVAPAKPLNMRGHAGTWEEELVVTARERDRLREAFGILAPICRDCDRPLGVDDVLANEQPGEDGVWTHPACDEAARAEARRD